VIVLVAGGLFALSMLFAPRRGVVAAFVRRRRLRVKIAADHVVETAIEHGGRLDRDAFRKLARLRGFGPLLRLWIPLHLRRLGLTTAAPQGLVLTESGTRRGNRVARNHRLWERYLITHADIAPSHIDWTVDQVEHVLDADVVRRLEAETEPTPDANGRRP
jgi:manganese/zinc/iron transport system permease protein